MKPRMRYLNGCIELFTNNLPGYDQVLKSNSIFTKHPTSLNVWYFFLNHAGAKIFKEHRDFFEKYWDIEEEVIEKLEGWVDYTNGHPKITQHNLKGITLLPYQQIAVNKMLTNKKYCIFLGQGTGKTLIAITFINSITKEQGYKKVLIVTPKKVIGQYQKECRKYLDHEVDIVNYESLNKVTEQYDIICYDESHRIKNCTSMVNKKAAALRAERIYLFTGSPQDKNKHEILAQLKVLQPYLFPAKYKVYERFFYLDEYGNPIKDKPNMELDEIISKMSYGEQTENLIDLPDQHHNIIECNFKNKEYYNLLKKNNTVEINGDIIIADSPVVLRMKLKQMCNGFLFYKKFNEKTCIETRELIVLENPKLEPLKKLVTTLNSGIIYTQFDYDIEVIANLLTSLNLSFVCVNGKTKDSDPLIDSFKKGEVKFLVIQAQSGNAGLDLFVTNNMIFYSLPDSYIVFEQCIYRMRRIGQTLECNYYYLITKGSIEPVIYRALKNKKSFNNKMFNLYRKEE